MGLYKHLRELWKKPSKTMHEITKARMVEFRKQGSTVRVEKPTRLDRARSLGYKAKQGIIVVRQRIPKGGHYKPKPDGGRRPKRYGRRVVLDKNYKQIAEERANKKYPNCEVLNSYWVAEDGHHKWFEVILVDRASPDIKDDKQLGWIQQSQHKGRAYRGLTSAGKKSRGLRNKGKGAEKLRPSRTATYKHKHNRRKKVR